MRNRKIYFLYLIPILIFVTPVFISSALESTKSMPLLKSTNPTPLLNRFQKEQRDLLKEMSKEIKQNKCDLANTNVKALSKIYKVNKDIHIKKLQIIRERIVDLSERVDSLGYDVTNINEMIEVLDEKIQVAQDKFDIFLEKLEQSRSFRCGNSQGGFVEAVKETRDSLKDFREAIQDARTYIRETIRPEMKSIKEWLIDQKVENEDEEKESAED